MTCLKPERGRPGYARELWSDGVAQFDLSPGGKRGKKLLSLAHEIIPGRYRCTGSNGAFFNMPSQPAYHLAGASFWSRRISSVILLSSPRCPVTAILSNQSHCLFGVFGVNRTERLVDFVGNRGGSTPLPLKSD